MNKEKLIEKYFKDCILRKRLNEKTIKAYRIDLDQFSKYVDDNLTNPDKISDYIYYLNNEYEKPKTIKRKIAS